VGGSLAATGFPNAVSSAAYDVANEMTGWMARRSATMPMEIFRTTAPQAIPGTAGIN
jgi:hypothetical protein